MNAYGFCGAAHYDFWIERNPFVGTDHFTRCALCDILLVRGSGIVVGELVFCTEPHRDEFYA